MFPRCAVGSESRTKKQLSTPAQAHLKSPSYQNKDGSDELPADHPVFARGESQHVLDVLCKPVRACRMRRLSNSTADFCSRAKILTQSLHVRFTVEPGHGQSFEEDSEQNGVARSVSVHQGHNVRSSLHVCM